MVYKLRFDRAKYLVGDIGIAEIRAKLGNPFALKNAERWADIWQPLEIKFRDDSDKKNVITPPDITCWFTDDLILNTKAYDGIGKALAPYGEFLPATAEGIQYWIFHVTKKVNDSAIDQEGSEREVEEGGFVNLKQLAFKDSEVRDLLLFKTEYSGYRNIYCTEAFKSLVDSASLKGLLFSDDLASIL